MTVPRPLSRRPLRTVGALALTVALAAAGTGCGGSDDEPTTSTTAAGGTTTTQPAGSGAATSGGDVRPAGNAPEANEDAIREALRRGPAAAKAAKTARITTEQSVIGIETSGSGTIDLANQTVLLEQKIGGGSGGGTVRSYVEGGKSYIQTPGSSSWMVADTPAAASDPLAQVRLLEKADITKVGGTRKVGGKTCREFDAEVPFKDIAQLLGGAAGGAIDKLQTDARIPVTSCIDDSGLAYSSESTFDIKDIAGDIPGGSGLGKVDTKSSSKLEITDYGTAPAPERPAGIDDAKPLSSGSGSSTGTS
jgi:hypothetical protein